MERAIGEVFECNGARLQTMIAIGCSCSGCFFNNDLLLFSGDYKDTGKCSSHNRRDKNDVIFVKVEDDKNKEGKL